MQMEKDEKQTLTRNDLAKELQYELGSVVEARRFVSIFFETLKETIAENDEVKIHGFGNFRCLSKRARVGRNLKTGEEVEISSRRVVSFIAGGRFRRMMQDDYEK